VYKRFFSNHDHVNNLESRASNRKDIALMLPKCGAVQCGALWDL